MTIVKFGAKGVVSPALNSVWNTHPTAARAAVAISKMPAPESTGTLALDYRTSPDRLLVTVEQGVNRPLETNVLLGPGLGKDLLQLRHTIKQALPSTTQK
jgi:hypothetical protein